MKSPFIIILTLFAVLNVFATAQYPDKLIYNGIEYNLQSNPLEIYFQKNPDKRPKGTIISSALWRGYVATFEIIDKELFLKDIQINYEDSASKETNDYKWKSVINEVFPQITKIKIDWLLGLLVVPQGKLVNYVHLSYGSTYENYLLLEFNVGNLRSEKKFNHKDYVVFKEKQFQAYKLTSEYKKIKSDLKKDGDSNKFIESFLRNYVSEYTTIIPADWE